MSKSTDELVKRYTDKFVTLNQGMMELGHDQFHFSREAFDQKMKEIVRLRTRRERISITTLIIWLLLTIMTVVITVCTKNLDTMGGLGVDSSETVGLTAMYGIIIASTNTSIAKVETEISAILNQLQNSQNTILSAMIDENQKLQKALDLELKNEKEDKK